MQTNSSAKEQAPLRTGWDKFFCQKEIVRVGVSDGERERGNAAELCFTTSKHTISMFRDWQTGLR